MEQLNLRAKYEAQYARARGNLLAMLLLTLVNVVLMIAEAEVSFLFSAILPQVAINYGWYLDAWLGGSTYTWIAYAISVLTVALLRFVIFFPKSIKAGDGQHWCCFHWIAWCWSIGYTWASWWKILWILPSMYGFCTI